MESRDVVVIGAGISGASFAFHAAKAGREVLVLEAADRVGGCLHTVRGPGEFWFELGAHTFYNSYGSTIELLEARSALSRLIDRAKPVLRMIHEGRLAGGKNLGLLLRRFNKLELLMRVPRWLSAKKEGATVREYYGHFVGASNYERVLGPILSAVPSQSADEFPADLLFKKRPRREDVRRSFTFDRGATTLVEVALEDPAIEVRTSAAVRRVEPEGDGFAITLADGSRVRANDLALAVSPRVAALLCKDLDAELALACEEFEETSIETIGVVLPKERVALPAATFFIPTADLFHSIVTRDVVPHDSLRAFTFHFRVDSTREARLARISQLLGVSARELDVVHETSQVLPSPRLGHTERVARIDARLASKRLALTGNWFGGLSIEDCVQRSRAEWRRLATLTV